MDRLIQAFAALAEPTRRGIVLNLARGEASASDLFKRLNVLLAALKHAQKEEGKNEPC
jgi:DNA-binding transcriptional ArsR family regulator